MKKAQARVPRPTWATGERLLLFSLKLKPTGQLNSTTVILTLKAKVSEMLSSIFCKKHEDKKARVYLSNKATKIDRLVVELMTRELSSMNIYHVVDSIKDGYTATVGGDLVFSQLSNRITVVARHDVLVECNEAYARAYISAGLEQTDDKPEGTLRWKAFEGQRLD